MVLPEAILNTFRDGQFAPPMIGFLERFFQWSAFPDFLRVVLCDFIYC
jgi:hypothetical protein